MCACPLANAVTPLPAAPAHHNSKEDNERDTPAARAIAGWGRVVHISSIGGLGSSEGRSAYTATKAALIGITHTGALELGPYGITSNVVCPGPFLTDMPRNALPQHVQDQVAAKVPLKRWGQPSELAGPILMLVSEAGSYVNGAVIRIDGGLLSRAY